MTTFSIFAPVGRERQVADALRVVLAHEDLVPLKYTRVKKLDGRYHVLARIEGMRSDFAYAEVNSRQNGIYDVSLAVPIDDDREAKIKKTLTM